MHFDVTKSCDSTVNFYYKHAKTGPQPVAIYGKGAK